MAAAKKYRWPGSSALHTVSWEDQKAAVNARRTPGAAATPAAPAAAGGPLALPVDTAYLGQTESLRNQRDQSIAATRQGRDATLLDFGYSGTFDPNTDALTGGLTFDPSNAFSKAALLKKSYDISRSSAAQSMGSRGGLYQGAFQNQQDLINRGQLQAEDALQTSLTSWLANNAAAIGAARTNYETGVSGAAGDATDRAANLQNPNYSPTAPGVAAATGAAGTTSTSSTGGAGTQLYSWPTDAPGKKPSHTIPYSQHKTKPKTVTYTTGVKTP
jgi:hypothetical protein